MVVVPQQVPNLQTTRSRHYSRHPQGYQGYQGYPMEPCSQEEPLALLGTRTSASLQALAPQLHMPPPVACDQTDAPCLPLQQLTVAAMQADDRPLH